MELRRTEHLTKMPADEASSVAAAIDWIVQLRTVRDEAGTHFELRLVKDLPWAAVPFEFAPSDFYIALGEFSEKVAAAFRDLGAVKIAAISLPHYLVNSERPAYGGHATSASLEDIARGWASFDYVIAALSSSNDVKALIIVTVFDYGIIVGPREFADACLGSSAASTAALLKYARGEKREDIVGVISELSKYQELEAGCSVTIWNN